MPTDPGSPGGLPGDFLSDRAETWPLTSSRRVYDGRWIVNVREDVIESPNNPGVGFPRVVIEHPGAVVVLAVDDDERVCVIKQYRHAGGGVFVELPAGVCDHDGEDPLEVAKRELREEVELEATHWRPLIRTVATPGVSAEEHHIYLATGLRPASRGDFAMEHEEAELEQAWVPMADLLDAVLDGRIASSPVVVAVLAYHAVTGRAPSAQSGF